MLGARCSAVIGLVLPGLLFAHHQVQAQESDPLDEPETPRPPGSPRAREAPHVPEAPRAPAPATLLFQPGDIIAFEGDSLTSRSGEERHSWSYLRLSQWDDTWPNVVEDWFFCNRPQLGLKFRNAAIGGSTMQSLLKRYDRTIKRIKPNWVLLTTGGNDARRVPAAEYERDFEAYVRKLKEDFGARAVVVDIFHPALWPATPAAEKRPAFMAIARRVLARHNGVYINASEVLYANAQAIKKQWDGHTVMADGGHLNAVGAQIVGTEVLRAIGALAW